MEQHIGQPEQQNQQEKLVCQIFNQATALVEKYAEEYESPLAGQPSRKIACLDFPDKEDLRKATRILIWQKPEKGLITIHYNQYYTKGVMLNTQATFSQDRVVAFSADILDTQGGDSFVGLPFNNPSEEMIRIMGKRWSPKEVSHGILDLNLINKFLTEGKPVQIHKERDTETKKNPLALKLKRLIGK